MADRFPSLTALKENDSFPQLRCSIYLESDTCGGIFPHQQHQSSSINTRHTRKHTMTHMRYKKKTKTHTHRCHESEWKREIRWNNWPFGIHSRDSTVHGEIEETHTRVQTHTAVNYHRRWAWTHCLISCMFVLSLLKKVHQEVNVMKLLTFKQQLQLPSCWWYSVLWQGEWCLCFK